MDTKLRRQARYQRWYASLLRLYPQPFRDRFAEPMAQTFRDLCREQTNPLPLFLNTLIGIIRENATHMPQPLKNTLRVALWTLAVWMVPVTAAQFVPDWHWAIGGFVRVYLVLFAAAMALTLIAKRMKVWSYKAGVTLATVTALSLGWSTMVQTADSGHPERLWFLSVLAVGLIGAALARLKAPGLAFTLFAMAVVLTLITLVLPTGAAPDLAQRMAFGHALCVILFAGSGLLFRHAGLSASHRSH